MNNKNPYNVLGVKPTDSIRAIKKKYYLLCFKYHPDKNKEEDKENCKQKFQEINAAYRKIITVGAEEDESVPDDDEYFNMFKENIIKKSKIIGDFFKNFDKDKIQETIFSEIKNYKLYHEKTNSKEFSDDLYINVNVSLEDIYSNIEKVITMDINETCHDCIINDFKYCNKCNNTKIIGTKQHFVFNSGEKSVCFSECAHDESNKKRGNVIINIYPKHEIFQVIDSFDIIWNISLTQINKLETFTYIDKNIYTINNSTKQIGKHVYKNMGLFDPRNNERGNLIIDVNNDKLFTYEALKC